MYLTELHVENFKRIKAVSIRPDGSVVHIRGENGNGKSSILDSIYALFGGGRALPTVPIRKGEEQAVIKGDCGEFRITRTFKTKDDGGYTTSLKVEMANGSRPDKPQDMLNSLVGNLSFDPLKFTRMDPAEQFNTLRKLVPGVDFDAINRANKADFDKRTDVNRQAKSAREQANAIMIPPGKIPARVDTGDVVTKIGAATTHNLDIDRRKYARDAANAEIMRINAEISALIVKRSEIEKKLDEAPDLPEPIDVEALNEKLRNASATNKVVDDYERRKRLEEEAEKAEADSAALTKAMDDRETAKREAIAAAAMPVDGLGFGDGCIFMDGLPFEQASMAQQIRTSLAIATALNPKLRLIMIKDGSLLDREAMKWVEAHAEKNDMQVWVEIVSTDGAGFIIEDGEVKEAEEESF